MCPSVVVYVTVSVSVTNVQAYSWFEFTTAVLGLMRKRASPCWLQLCTVGMYHPRPLRDAHSSRRILRVRVEDWHCNFQVYVVGSTTVVTNTQPCWADATFCYPVSLNVRCKYAEVTAVGWVRVQFTLDVDDCRLQRMPFRSLPWRGNYSPPSLTETTCLLLTYVLTPCVNAVDHIVAPSPSNNTL